MKLFVNIVIAITLLCGTVFPQPNSKEDIQAKIRQLEQRKRQNGTREIINEPAEQEPTRMIRQDEKQETQEKINEPPKQAQGYENEKIESATAPVYMATPQNYTGNGGKGISLTIFVPQSTGLASDQSYIPALVQGEFVSNFSNYSAISILDWERLDDIYVKLVNEAYDDKAAAKQDVVLGRLAPTSHFLTGNITKTKTGYNIKMNITATADKMTAATYSGTFSFAELDDLTGIRRASLELLQKVGVTLTEKARLELAGAAEANQISAQTALAKGVTAQRAGTEVTALSYYFQAASFDPALKEAVKRSSIVAANISSGNIGVDLRNDIEWRKNWVAKLKETEEIFYEMINSADPPYTLFYFTDIKRGKVNYQTETIDLSITTDLSADRAWFAALEQAFGAVRAVSDGLNATNRKDNWELQGWPWSGVSKTNPFASPKSYNITVVFELVNQKGLVIGSQTVKLYAKYTIVECQNNSLFAATCKDNDRFKIRFDGNKLGTVNFNGVKANDISDNLTIRVATVNGVAPQKARFAVTAMPSLSEKSQPLVDTRDGKRYNTVRIGSKIWMAENLNYQPQAGNSWCYDDNNSYCDKYGRLYDWNTAKIACPSKWHLLTDKEFEYLINLAGGYDVAGKTLKSKSGWNENSNGTDDFGFSVLPSGYYNGKYSTDVGNLGLWWIRQNNNDEPKSSAIDKGNGISGYYSKKSHLPVRCLRDD